MVKNNIARSVLFTLIFFGLFFGLLYEFIWTLKSKVDLPLPPVSITGPAEYINPDANPVHANIGVTVNSIGNLDLATGIYFMDFYLTIICDRSCDPDVDILNASSSPEIEALPGDNQGGTFHNYRIRANLLTEINMQNYPFDQQVLSLTIGDKKATKDELVFNADPSYSTWNYGELYSLGWLIRPELEVQSVEWSYPYRGGLFSRFIFSARVYKPWFSSFVTYFLPVIIVMLVSFLSFLLKAEAATERLTLTSSTLVALILFHININTGVPPQSTLTYADKIMLANYFVCSISIAISAIILVLRDSDNMKFAQRFNEATRWLIPLLWAGLLLIVTMRQFSSGL
jgi:hypothetical protein